MTTSTRKHGTKVSSHNLVSLMGLAVTTGLLLQCLGCGGGPGTAGQLGGSSKAQSCQQACAKVYDQCKFAIDNATKAECVSTCQSDPKLAPAASCLISAPCNASAMERCLSTGGSTGGTTGGSSSDCTAACKTIYQTCGLTFSDSNNNSISQTQCVSICGSSQKSNIASCVSQANCTGNSIIACF